MAEQGTPDPAAAFRDLISQWEKQMNELAGKTMNSDAFTRTMNKATASSASMQQQLGELIGRYLTTLNLPSRSEMTNIGERLQSIETNLHRMNTMLEKLTAASSTALAAGPPRTKRPPSATERGAS
ncbi:MAG: hypothetical protein NVSMB26_08710 [Beijerinckiaceae bacterium]